MGVQGTAGRRFQGMRIPALHHKTCTSALLSRRLFTGTQRICALLCTQRAALGYNSPVLCLYTPTRILSTSPATYLGKVKREEGDTKPKSHKGPNCSRVEVLWLFSYSKDTPSNTPPKENENPLGFLCYRRPRQMCYLSP